MGRKEKKEKKGKERTECRQNRRSRSSRQKEECRVGYGSRVGESESEVGRRNKERINPRPAREEGDEADAEAGADANAGCAEEAGAAEAEAGSGEEAAAETSRLLQREMTTLTRKEERKLQQV